MHTRLYRFAFNAPLHISNARADYGKSHNYLHSDSLLAAVMDTWAKIGKAEWIDEFAQIALQDATKTPLVFTGAYPYGTNAHGMKLQFVPKPYYQPRVNKTETGSTELNRAADEAKKFKKLQWIAWRNFVDLLQAKPLDKAEHIHGAYYTGSADAFEAPYQSAVQARVQKPRDETKDAQPYYVERLYFRPGCGLYTIVSAANETWQKRCETAFNVLQHLGLGTDRAVGNGQFDLKTEDFAWPELPPSDYYINMGLYAPADSAQLAQAIGGAARFETIKRGGWIGEPYNTYRKKSVMMLREGSLLRLGKDSPRVVGTLHNLQPETVPVAHPIYRSGVSLLLPATVIEDLLNN